MKKLFILTLSVGCSLLAVAGSFDFALYEAKSEFVPGKAPYNSYMNTLYVTNIDDVTTFSVQRSPKAGPGKGIKKTVAKVTINGDLYKIEYVNSSWPTTSGQVNDGFKIIDKFTASTAANHLIGEKGGDKAQEYYYTVTAGSSETLTVPVYASSILAELTNGYTLEQIQNETNDNQLDPQAIEVSFDAPEAADNYTIYWYNESESKFEFLTDLNPGNKYKYNGLQSTEMPFVGAIKVGDNTYGTDVRTVYPAVTSAEVTGNYRTQYWWRDKFGEGSYFNNIISLGLDYKNNGNLNTLPVPEFGNGGFRVWRTCEDMRVDNYYDPTPAESDKNNFKMYDNLGQMTDMSAGFGNSISIGAEGQSDSYVGPFLFGANKSKPTVKYRVRTYYCLKAPQTGGGLNAPALKATDNNKYYISEFSFEYTFPEYNDDLVTGVTGVDANKQVSSVEYVNLAGVKSATPHSGMNIVVTRYTDGSMSTAKVIK